MSDSAERVREAERNLAAHLAVAVQKAALARVTPDDMEPQRVVAEFADRVLDLLRAEVVLDPQGEPSSCCCAAKELHRASKSRLDLFVAEMDATAEAPPEVSTVEPLESSAIVRDWAGRAVMRSVGESGS